LSNDGDKVNLKSYNISVSVQLLLHGMLNLIKYYKDLL